MILSLLLIIAINGGGTVPDWVRLFTSLVELLIAILLWYGYGKIRNAFVKIVMTISIVALFMIGGYNFVYSLI